MKTIYKRGFVILLFFLQMLSAANISVAEIAKNLNAQREQIKSYTADVVNSVEGAFIDGKKVQQSNIYFQLPGNIRSELTEPSRYITLTKDGKSYVIDQRGQYQELEQEQSTLADELRDSSKLFDKFNFTVTETSQNIIVLEGVPKSSSSKDIFSSQIFSKVVFELDAERYFSRAVKIYDKTGREIAVIKTEHVLIDDIYFPYKTITSLNAGGSRMVIETIYQNIFLNCEISPEVFDLETICGEIKGEEK